MDGLNIHYVYVKLYKVLFCIFLYVLLHEFNYK